MHKNICDRFKGYFQVITVRSGIITLEIKIWTKVFCFCSGKIYNELPPNARKTETKTAFASYLNEHFS